MRPVPLDLELVPTVPGAASDRCDFPSNDSAFLGNHGQRASVTGLLRVEDPLARQYRLLPFGQFPLLLPYLVPKTKDNF